MNKKSGRRSFIKNIGLGGTAAALFPGAITTDAENLVTEKKENGSAPQAKRKYNGAYTGEYLNRVAFPIGGMGAGMFCMIRLRSLLHWREWAQFLARSDCAVFVFWIDSIHRKCRTSCSCCNTNTPFEPFATRNILFHDWICFGEDINLGKSLGFGVLSLAFFDAKFIIWFGNWFITR